ncbi:hypothetical protein L2E82_35158 [Cichorium intybus]|uniref:Uncharacterized protein n=1 Tax=Cichorium intybus TaxID=13427 RepID=A0ACB9BND8_CICIN|nr:hypothetical protein L2E82_35158 [Cichorium intybus]
MMLPLQQLRSKMATFMVPQRIPGPPGPRDDALHLHNAFKGAGCDISTIIGILAHRNASQRALIEKAYNKTYSDDLTKRLSLKLDGNIKKAVLLWMPDPPHRDAVTLHEAFTEGNDLKAAIEVLCSKTSTELQHLKKLYHTLYSAYLEHEIISHTSGDLEKVCVPFVSLSEIVIPVNYGEEDKSLKTFTDLWSRFAFFQMLLAYLSIPRSDGKEFDKNTAISDANALFEAGENRMGSDKKTFIIIFTGRSRAQLAAVSSEYQRLHGNTLKKAIMSQTSGNFEDALVTILQCAENTALYFAKVLRKTKKVIGTDDHTTLIRVIVSRAEIDMQFIKSEYHKENHKSLDDAVYSMTSGDYRTFLLSLLGTF